MAGFAIKTAMTARESKQRQPRGRRVRRRRKRRVRRHPHVRPGVEYRCVTDLAAVVRRGTRVAGLTVRFLQPTRPRRRPDHAHRSMAILALHRHRTIRRHRAAHRTAQTTRGRPGMASITRRAVVGRVEREPIRWIRHSGMTGMHRFGKWFNTGEPGTGQRFRQMTARAEDRVRIHCHCGIQPTRIKTTRGQCARIRRIRRLLLVVQAENIQPVVALHIGIIHPPRRWFRGVGRTRRVTGPTIHFVRYGQDHIQFPDNAASIPGDQAHDGISILGVRVIIRSEGDTVGCPPRRRG